MVHLQNELLAIDISTKGAELQRVHHLQHAFDYLWHADPEHWGKHAPVLFPIVGALKDNTYLFANRAYSLSRHGFARDKTFEVKEQSNDSVAFQLQADATTKEVYPFDFTLVIRYTLQANKLINTYEVTNNDRDTMMFSIGGHPAFNVPLQPGIAYHEYYLEFSHAETAPRWPLHNNLVKTHPQPLLNNQTTLPLSHDLFKEDAVVFKQLRSTSVSLKSHRSRHGLTMQFEGFPYLGIWAPVDAPFVCIEPWCGLADSLHHNQQLAAKEGINALNPGDTWIKSWDVTFW